MKFKFIFLIILYFFTLHNGICQTNEFTRYDSLRGYLTPFRTCYDINFYDLNLTIDIGNKFIKGFNNIHFLAIDDFSKIQIDLFSNLKIDSIIYKNKKLSFQRDSNAIFVSFNEIQKKDTKNFIGIYYCGNPNIAKNPPWEGGFVWSTDSAGNPWVGVTCEGIGASLWWPCKDHPSDEPDSARMTFSVPSNLYCISNGNLVSEKNLKNGFKEFIWRVSYPINSYNVTLNIGDYFHISDNYLSRNEKTLNLDYYVLKYNADTAKKHFVQVKKILECYEKYFGIYPFPKDGFALIETPYRGMEHQSAIAYGNNYQNDLMDFDFIIVHESAHEWWGNSLSASDMGELWIHEAFATYAEALLVECFYGYKNSLEYLLMQKDYIENKEPMVMPLNVNYFHRNDSDIYYKGSWMLHTLRNVISNDSLWFDIIAGLASDYKMRNINTKNIIDYFNKKSGKELSFIFEQYLNYARLPKLVYSVNKKRNKIELAYKWDADIENFNMPVIIELGKDKQIKLCPSSEFQIFNFKQKNFEDIRIATELFYIETEKI